MGGRAQGAARAREHHVDEEESRGFGCARHDFGKDELEAMAQRGFVTATLSSTH
jgi:hypothetical protein